MTSKSMSHEEFKAFLVSLDNEDKRVVLESKDKNCFHYALTEEDEYAFCVYVYMIDDSALETIEFQTMREAYAYYIQQIAIDCLSTYAQDDDCYKDDSLFMLAISSDIVTDIVENEVKRLRYFHTLEHYLKRLKNVIKYEDKKTMYHELLRMLIKRVSSESK